MHTRALETESLRFYRGLLRLYPAEFREEYGRELCLVLVDRYREQRSLPGLALVWLHAAIGVLTEAPKEHWHVIVQDLRYALRVMRKDAPMTLAAIAILGLGIGSTTLVFSLANGVLVRPLPYRAPERLIAVDEYPPNAPEYGRTVAFPNYQDMRARATLIEDLGVYSEQGATIRGEGPAELVRYAGVSDGVLRILGVQPLLGRLFNREDDLPNGPKVVILSRNLWASRYGADPGILGRTIDLDTTRYTVIGVMPGEFQFPERAELWRPLQLTPAQSKRTDHYLQAVARLKPGVSVEQASAELNSIMEGINRENPVTDGGRAARAVPIRDYVAGSYRTAVTTLMVAVAFLLAIACANISNLLLVKSSARAGEMAVRRALGATRRRLVRQLASESLLLGLAGGAAGLVLAWVGIPALISLIPADTLPRWMSFAVDGRVLLFAFAVSVGTSIGFGIVPAISASGAEMGDALKRSGRGGGTGARQQLLRHGLVVGEVALSLILLTGAGLMVKSFLALRTQHLGYRSENVLTLQLNYPDTRYRGPQARASFQRLREEVSTLPGVSSLVFASGVPLQGQWGRSLTVEGHPVLSLKDAPSIFHVLTTPGYFRTLGIPLLEGRDFAESDYDQPLVTIVAESLARQYWPRQSALGKRVRYGPPEANEPWHTVIGVVADSKNDQIRGENRPNTYIPYSSLYSSRHTPANLMLRTTGDPLGLVQAVRARIGAADRDIAVGRLLSLEQVVDQAAWRERFFAVLFAVFAALAMVLAAVGLYSVLAYAVSLRTHEIGVRLALGAPAARLRAMVVRQGLALAGAGVIAGALGAFALTRLLRTQLFNVSPMDPGTYAGVTLLLLLVALAAAFLPTRRATRVDPVIALRHE